jgi:hypothetical protein
MSGREERVMGPRPPIPGKAALQTHFKPQKRISNKLQLKKKVLDTYSKPGMPGATNGRKPPGVYWDRKTGGTPPMNAADGGSCIMGCGDRS